MTAFFSWSTVLAVAGYFDEYGKVNTPFLVFGFFWLTVPVSFATYLVPRLLLHVVPLINGYDPKEDRQRAE